MNLEGSQYLISSGAQSESATVNMLLVRDCRFQGQMALEVTSIPLGTRAGANYFQCGIF